MALMRTPIRRLVSGLAVVAALTALLASAAPVVGHAQLLSATPAPGSTVTVAPTQVSATFDDELDAPKSSLLVAGPGGSTVGQGGVSSDDPKTMVASITAAGPGGYEVRWTAATPDGHIERGTYGFVVSAPAASPSLAANGAPSPGPSAGPGSPAGTAGDSGPLVVAAAAVAGLVLGGGIAWWRRRQQR
jgi:hypothetical protein